MMFDFSTEIVFLAVIAFRGIQVYEYYFKRNDTDKIDLMGRYTQRQLALKYRYKGYDQKG